MNSEIGKLLVYKGEQFRKIGLVGAVITLSGIALGILTGIVLVMNEYHFLELVTNPFGIISFIADALGCGMVPFYFIGLHYLGLGQIIRNTESKANIDSLPNL